jgi:hypothetical protein
MSRSHIQAPPRAAAAALISTLVLLAPAVNADPIGYALGGGGPELYRIDLATVEVEQIGPTGPIGEGRVRLTFHADGTLYGLVGSGVSLRLVAFDPATGTGQVVAEFALDLPSFELYGFAGVADGGLWAAGLTEDAQGGYHGVILAIDPAGGTAGEPVVIQGGGPFEFGLAACGNQLLLLRAGLFAIDPVTGERTELFAASPPAEGVDVGPDGGLWTVYTGPLPGTFPPPHGRVYRMDLATGEIVQVGGTGVFHGLAISPPVAGACIAGTPLAVPTLSPLALVVLAISLVVAARWVRRRHA